MSMISIESQFEITLSKLMTALQQEVTERILDPADAIRLLDGLKPRSVRVLVKDIECWFSWWQESRKSSGVALHRSAPEYLENLISIGRRPNTVLRYQYSISHIMRALGFPVEIYGKDLYFNLRACRVEARKDGFLEPKGTPYGRDIISKCIRTVDPNNRREVKALAGMIVMYETMAWSDQVFGHRSGGYWISPPARQEDLRETSDGGGLLYLKSMKQDEPGREKTLSPAAMKWIKLASSFGGSQEGPLFTCLGSDGLIGDTWRRWARALIARSGVDARRFSWASLRLGMVNDMKAAGLTVDDVLRDGGWSGRLAVVRLLHGKPRNHMRSRSSRPKGFKPHLNTYEGGGQSAIPQMSLPGI